MLAHTRSKAKAGVKENKPQGSDYDYLSIPNLKDNAKKETNGPAAQVTPEKTQPLETIEVKHRFNIFHRNGKKPKKMVRVQCFTVSPYGFKETTMEESLVQAAHITPVQDDVGAIYLVIKKTGDDGQEELSRWPGGIAYPKVPSAKLGRARSWDMVKRIASAGKSSGMNLQAAGVWVIVGAVLILIFFMAYFFLMGGS